MIKLAPSLLAADFSRLGEEIKNVHENGAQYLHLDVMDGMFVPNISLGPGMIASLRKVSNIVFDVHLMIMDPIRYIDAFAKAGADIITFHYEACQNHREVIEKIHSYGIRAGMSVKPNTDAALMVRNADAPQELVPALMRLANDKELQQKLSTNIGKFARPNAADDIVEQIIKAIE